MKDDAAMRLEDHIRAIPDHPKPGILFRDVTTLLSHPAAFRTATDRLCDAFRDSGAALVAGIEARGFIIGAAVAHGLGTGFVPLRKKGKLPWRTISETYDLEYGADTLEMHEDALRPGDRVLLIDDLIATGGTAAAAVSLIRRAGATAIGLGAIVELPELGGRARLAAMDMPVTSLVTFDGH